MNELAFGAPNEELVDELQNTGAIVAAAHKFPLQQGLCQWN
jgi:hypothetical protein